MLTTSSRLMAAASLSAALLAGCGGSNDDHNNSPGAGGQPGAGAQTVTDVVAFINGLIAGTSDSAEPLDIDGLTLTADNGSDSAPLP